MSKGTDAEILGEIEEVKISIQRGRPKVNRDLAKQLINAGKSTRDIRKILKCSAKTVRNIKQELIDSGEYLASHTPKDELDKNIRDFDNECQEVMGFGFKAWLQAHRGDYLTIFNFCERIWTKVWDKPALWIVKDVNNHKADQLAIQFMQVFGEDKARIRNRKKHIRKFFQFMGRQDINDRHLTMTRSRDPVPVRRISEITLTDFPAKIEKAINILTEKMGKGAGFTIRFKIATLMRTGGKDRELWGLKKGGTNGSSLIMDSPDQYRLHISAKAGEHWDINWIPRELRHELYEIYQSCSANEKIIKVNVDKIRKAWKAATLEAGLPELRLHDLRKIGLTWLWAMGIPLEIATTLNCGWRDLNTARDFYLHYRRILSRDDRAKYVANIPAWFKQGLDQFKEE